MRADRRIHLTCCAVLTIVIKLSEAGSTSSMPGSAVYLSAPPNYETAAENRGEGARKGPGRTLRLSHLRPLHCAATHSLIRFNRAPERQKVGMAYVATRPHVRPSRRIEYGRNKNMMLRDRCLHEIFTIQSSCMPQLGTA